MEGIGEDENLDTFEAKVFMVELEGCTLIWRG